MSIDVNIDINELVNEFCTRVLYFGWLNRRERMMAMLKGSQHLFPTQVLISTTIPAYLAHVVPDDLCDSNLIMNDVIEGAGIPPQHHDQVWREVYRQAARLDWRPLAGRRGRHWLMVSDTRIGAEVVGESYFTHERGFDGEDQRAIMGGTNPGYQILMREPDSTVFIHLGEATV